MPQVTNLMRKTNSVNSMPIGTGESSGLLSQTFQCSVDRLPYKIFSRSSYQDFLYSLEPFEVLLPAFNKIYNLLALSEGWNGYDGCAPEYAAVEYAHRWISLLYREVASLEKKWLEPNITASGEGEVVFEWWQRSKKLTIYIGNRSAEYVKVWGPDINTDMEDGQADSPDMRRLLWKWLMS
jgi:hypothetical protein